jgi:hypothetical protein
MLLPNCIRYGVTRRNCESWNLLESIYESAAFGWREIGGALRNFAHTFRQED